MVTMDGILSMLKSQIRNFSCYRWYLPDTEECKWNREIVPKSRYKVTTLRCVIAQKSAGMVDVIIVTVIRTLVISSLDVRKSSNSSDDGAF